MKIAIWWVIPCKSVVPIARELADIEGVNVTFITEMALSDDRVKLGWEVPDFGNAEFLTLSNGEWHEEVEELLNRNFDIHIFNGVYLFPKITYTLDLAQKMGLRTAVISEAPFNPYLGIKRFAKKLFTKYITPFKVKRRAKKASFILSASGNVVEPFVKLGWDRRKVFPYAYFPELNQNVTFTKKEKEKSSKLQLLCTGYLVKNKGHHLLLQALSELKKNNFDFECIVTGFGPELTNLKKLQKELSLEEEVHFIGVVEDNKLNNIKQNTDIFVAPGIEEPWGIRINEAILSHIPTVVSDRIGASQFIEVSGAGKVFKSNDVGSLYQALCSLFENSEVLLQCKVNAERFSEKIEPRIAAKYLLEVINYTDINFNLRTITKPIPEWL